MQVKRPYRQQAKTAGPKPIRRYLCPMAIAIGVSAGLLAVPLLHTKAPPATFTASAALSTAAPSPKVRPNDPNLAELGLGRLARLVSLVDDPAEACLAIGGHSRRTREKTELSRLFAILSRSAVGAALLARAQGTLVCLDRRTDLMGYYRSGLRLIGINDRLAPAERIVFLAHELAHVPQHGAYSDNRYYPVNDLILLRRVREATAEALSTLIVWQLREQGEPAAWNAKIADRFYGDIARSFAEAWHGAPAGERNHMAARAAFDRWFAAAARRRLYDRMTVDHLHRISSDTLGLVSPRKRLRDSFLRGIAWVDSRNFLIASGGPMLTAPLYAGGVSLRHAAILERLLESEAQRPVRSNSGRSGNHAEMSRGRWARHDRPGA